MYFIEFISKVLVITIINLVNYCFTAIIIYRLYYYLYQNYSTKVINYNFLEVIMVVKNLVFSHSDQIIIDYLY